MTLKEIFKKFTIGSDGMVKAIADNCGFEASNAEIKRICDKSEDYKDFQEIWENYIWWKDGFN